MALWLLLALAVATAYATQLDFPITSLSDKVHVIYGPFDLPTPENQGFRNNVVIVQTSAGIVVFDPGGSNSAGEMVVRKVKSLTKQPIIAVFDSHAHGDHWLGNEAIKKHYPNAVIYGHKLTQQRIQGAEGLRWLNTINRLTDNLANGQKVVAPDKIVRSGDVITIGDTAFRIYHTGKAHTNCDIMIEIVGQDILFSGDVIRNGLLGIMEEDASFKGNIKAIDLIINKQFSIIIPGHGPAGGVEIARSYQQYLQAILADVQKYYEQGIADFEMKPKILPKVSKYKDWAGFDMRLGPHISRAYLEVENESF
jgi:glyoxylase-like metal-dependent hydrolase (beta-lactamase superfamily II)